MRLTHRSILSTFLRLLGFTIIGARILFTLLDLLDHMDSFVDNGATRGQVFRYYLNKVPWIIDTVLPIGMLMATLFTVGTMARYNELTALFAAGRSLLQVTRPLVVLAFAAALFSLAWSEYVLPNSNAEVEHIWEVEVHGRPDRVNPTTDIALYGDDGRLYYARTYVPDRQEVKQFRIHRFEGARAAERLDAQRAAWDGAQWVLFEGTHRRFTGDVDSVTVFQRLETGLSGVTPETFQDDRLKPESMNIRRLARYIALIDRSGGDTWSSSWPSPSCTWSWSSWASSSRPVPARRPSPRASAGPS
jgi:lipopolysaccharide export system permease protein